MMKSKSEKTKVFRIIITIEIVACIIAFLVLVGNVRRYSSRRLNNTSMRSVVWDLETGGYYSAYMSLLRNKVSGVNMDADVNALYNAGKYFQERFVYEAVKDKYPELANKKESLMQETAEITKSSGYEYTIQEMDGVIDKYSNKD